MQDRSTSGINSYNSSAKYRFKRF